MKKPISFIIVLSGIILMLSVLQVIVSNMLSTAGITLSNLQREIKQYKTENIVLSEKLLLVSSLTAISAQAEKLGFIDAQSQIIIGSPIPLAIQR